MSLDIGNSLIKAGSFKNNRLNNFVRIKSVKDLLRYIHFHNPKYIAASTVVPDTLLQIEEELKGKEVFRITHQLKFSLTYKYKNFQSLGIDRICACEGAASFKEVKDDYILVMDFGTATTCNLISPDKEFLGGSISPGIHTMFHSLNLSTSQLPDLNLKEYRNLIGENTNENIASGVLHSSLGMIDRVISFIRKEYSPSLKILTTGGNYDQLKDYFDFEHQYVMGLNLIGIKKIYELNN